jgi:hypothetical protein
VSIDPHRGILTIESSSAEKDDGTYSCRATNNVNDKETLFATVRVKSGGAASAAGFNFWGIGKFGFTALITSICLLLLLISTFVGCYVRKLKKDVSSLIFGLKLLFEQFISNLSSEIGN